VIEIFDFDPNAPSFGELGGRITDVQFLSPASDVLSIVEGGNEVVLEITCMAERAIARPIIGFLVKDRLGQALFGDNTYLTALGRSLRISIGERLRARFQFQMPYLPAGDYAVTVALAEGTQDDHVQHHWLDEALIFRCDGSHVRQGLIGIPMHDISVDLL
jgi:lipopolysaccharide transport system ATP-binding protein